MSARASAGKYSDSDIFAYKFCMSELMVTHSCIKASDYGRIISLTRSVFRCIIARRRRVKQIVPIEILTRLLDHGSVDVICRGWSRQR